MTSTLRLSKHYLRLSTLAGLLVGAVIIIYLPALNYTFLNFDDDIYITNNPQVRTGISFANIKWAFSNVHAGHWHPLTWISHMLDCELFGLNAGAHHFVNVCIHAFNTALVFVFLYKLSIKSELLSTALAFALAAIFGLHPLRLESVVWISERKDVLSLFFAIATLLSYLKFTENGKIASYLFTLLLLTLGLLSKPMLVTVPILMLLLDFWPLERWRSKTYSSLAIEKFPFLALSISSSAIAILAQSTDGALNSLGAISLADRFANASLSYIAYLGKLIIPSNLSVFYPWQPPLSGAGLGAACALIIISIWCFSRRESSPYMLFGWLWFVISLLPVIGLVQIGGQALADRWTYLPHIGFLIAVGAAVRRQSILVKYHRLLSCVSALVVITYGLATILSLPNWANSETLFSHALSVNSSNFMAHTNLGVDLERQGREAEAALHFEEAARLNPTYPEALNNLGLVRAKAGRFLEARDLFRRAIKINNKHVTARYNLGLVSAQLGEPHLAVIDWLNVLRLDPNYMDARESLRLLIRQRRLELCTAFSSKDNLLLLNHEYEHLSSSQNDRAISDAISQITDCNS